jgi:RecB family exonuclease
MLKLQILKERPSKEENKKINFYNLSVSKIKTFKSCRQKFKFVYIDKLPTKSWEHTITGKFNHLILEHFGKEIINGYSGPENSLMSVCFNKALDASPDEDLRSQTPEIKEKNSYRDILSSEQIKETKVMCNSFLKDRYNNKKNETLYKFLAVENPFFLNIDDKVMLNGVIDVELMDHDGVLNISDYKTSKSKEFLKKDLFQLKTYALIKFLENPELDKIRCSYILLRHDFEKITKEFNRKQIMSMPEDFLSQAIEMKDERLFRPSPSPLCKYCDYLTKCEQGLDYTKIDISFGETKW